MRSTKRLPDWEQRLDDYIKSVRYKRRVISIPSKSDDFDCGIFVMECIFQMTGQNLVCEAYRDPETFNRISSSKVIFDYYINTIASTYGLRAIRPEDSKKGDVLIFEWNDQFNARPLGIKVGSYTAIPGETCLGYIRSNLATAAYMV